MAGFWRAAMMYVAALCLAGAQATAAVAAVDPEAPDSDAGGVTITTTPDSTHIASTTSGGTAQAASTTTSMGTIPGCQPSSPSACLVTLTVTSSAEHTVGGSLLSGLLPSATSGSGAQTTASSCKYKLPTGCYSTIKYKTWSGSVCFVTCGSNKATQYGKFYYTPDGKFVWETGKYAGVVGYHKCRIDHSIGAKLTTKDCTAPRASNSSIHSHHWVNLSVGPAQELFLQNCVHNGSGNTSCSVKSY